MLQPITAAIILVAMTLPAAAQRTPHAAPGFDPQAAPWKAGRPDDTRPLRATPDAFEAAPRREAINQALETELRAWRERIGAYRQTANDIGYREAMVHGEELEAKWVIAKESWQRLNQTAGANWETSRAKFAYAYRDLKDAWAEAPPIP